MKISGLFTFVIKLVAASWFICFASCSTCPCVDANLDPNFVSFEPADLQTVILKRYNKDGRFVTALDSVAFYNEQHYRMELRVDTISFPVKLGNFSLDPNFDWIVSLPSLNQDIRISDIDKEEANKDCSRKVQCVNLVHSLSVNGTPQLLKDTYLDFYIRK